VAQLGMVTAAAGRRAAGVASRAMMPVCGGTQRAARIVRLVCDPQVPESSGIRQGAGGLRPRRASRMCMICPFERAGPWHTPGLTRETVIPRVLIPRVSARPQATTQICSRSWRRTGSQPSDQTTTFSQGSSVPTPYNRVFYHFLGAQGPRRGVQLRDPLQCARKCRPVSHIRDTDNVTSRSSCWMDGATQLPHCPIAQGGAVAAQLLLARCLWSHDQGRAPCSRCKPSNHAARLIGCCYTC
jgi:hypothetical protein